jgi:hypothetical protein
LPLLSTVVRGPTIPEQLQRANQAAERTAALGDGTRSILGRSMLPEEQRYLESGGFNG